MEILNITNNFPECSNGVFWNDVFLDRHHTHVPSENDANTIGGYLVTWITPENIH